MKYAWVAVVFAVSLLAVPVIGEGDNESSEAEKRVEQTMNNILMFLVGIAATVAAIMYAITGLQFMAAKENPEEQAKLKQRLVYITVGLIIVLMASTIAALVRSWTA